MLEKNVSERIFLEFIKLEFVFTYGRSKVRANGPGQIHAGIYGTV